MTEEENIEHIIFYGSLMQNLGGRKKIEIENDVEFQEYCKIKGQLYDLGEYPGLLPEGDNVITAELYHIKNLQVLEILDEFEGHNLQHPELSFFRRVAVQLDDPNTLAYVYYYNDSIEGAFEVHGGDWRSYIMAR